MKATSYDDMNLLASAYVALLRLDPDGMACLRLQPTLAALRDEIAQFEGKDSEHIQNRFESAARIFEAQSLGQEFEKVLFDNIWELYAR
jgi:hypothetical protein